MGFLLLARQFARIESAAFVIGLSRIGSVFALSVIDNAMTGSFSLMRSAAHLEPVSLILDFLHLGSLLSVHQFARVDFATLCFGLVRLGFAFAPSVIDTTLLGSSVLIRSFARLDSVVLIPDYENPDFVVLFRSSSQLELALSVSGKATSSSSLSLLDFASTDLSMFLRCPAQLGLSLLALNFVDTDSSTSLRQLACLDLGVLIFGLSRAGFVFSLLVVDRTNFEPSMSPRNYAHLGSVAPALDLLHLGPPVFMRCFCQAGFAMSASDYLRPDSTLFLQSSSRTEPTAFVLGRARTEPLVSLLDWITMDFSLSLQSPAHLSPTSSALDFAHMDLLPSVRDPACFDFFSSAVGCVRSGSVFSLSPMDVMTIASFMLSRSFARLGSLLPTSDFAKLDFPALLRQLAQLESPVLVVGLSRVGFVFALSTVDVACGGFPLPLRSLAQMDLFLLASDFGMLSSSVSLRHFACMGPLLFVCGLSRSELLTSLFDAGHLDSSLFARSFTRLGLFLLVLDVAHCDLSMLTRDFVRPESAILVSGLSCAGSVFVLPLIDCVTLGSTPSAQSFACPGFVSFVLDASRLGSLMLTRDFVRPGFAVFVLGLSRVGFVFLLSLIDFGHFGPSMSLQSYSQLGFAPFSMDLVMTGPAVFVRSFSQVDLVPSILNFVHIGFFMSARQYCRMGSALLAIGLTRPGLVFALLLIDSAHLDSFTSLRSGETRGMVAS